MYNATSIGIVKGNALAQEAGAIVVFVVDRRFGWIGASAGQGRYRVATGSGVVPTCAGADGGTHGLAQYVMSCTELGCKAKQYLRVAWPEYRGDEESDR